MGSRLYAQSRCKADEISCNLIKPFGNYVPLNTRSTAKNLCSRCDHNLTAWNQYYRPSCMSYRIEGQSYVLPFF